MYKRVASSCLLGSLVVACSASPSTDSYVARPAGAPASPAPGAAPASNVLFFIEGSFDAATHEMTLAYRDAATGALRLESTLPEGTAPGDVFLHTEGNGDGKAGPSWSGAPADLLTAKVDAENGTAGTVVGLTATLTFTPATVGMVATGGTTCSGALFDAAGAKTGPCAVAYGDVARDAGFPAPVVGGGQTWAIDDSANDGGSFHFSGTVTGAVANPGQACTLDTDCVAEDCLCAIGAGAVGPGGCAGNTGTCGAGKVVFFETQSATASVFSASSFPGCTAVDVEAWGGGGGGTQTLTGGGGAFGYGTFSGLTGSSTLNVWVAGGGGGSGFNILPGPGGPGFTGTGLSTAGTPEPGGTGATATACFPFSPPPAPPTCFFIGQGGGGGLTTVAFGATTVTVGGGGGSSSENGGGGSAAGSGTQPGMAGQDGVIGINAGVGTASGGGGAGAHGGAAGVFDDGGFGGSSAGGGFAFTAATGAASPYPALFDYLVSCESPGLGHTGLGSSGCVVVRCH